jgi:hypothetical protein
VLGPARYTWLHIHTGINQVWKAIEPSPQPHYTVRTAHREKRRKANLITVGFVANFSQVDSAVNATSKPLCIKLYTPAWFSINYLATGGSWVGNAGELSKHPVPLFNWTGWSLSATVMFGLWACWDWNVIQHCFPSLGLLSICQDALVSLHVAFVLQKLHLWWCETVSCQNPRYNIVQRSREILQMHRAWIRIEFSGQFLYLHHFLISKRGHSYPRISEVWQSRYPSIPGFKIVGIMSDFTH